MAAFGRNPFPRRFGGGKRAHQIEHEAMLDALAPAFDVTPDSNVYAETYAHAVAVAFVWALNGRLKNIFVPGKMLETLPIFEEAMRLRPAVRDSLRVRRQRVAAKLRGIIGNTLADLNGVCESVAGQNFVAIVPIPDASLIAYWPGVNPGPPGFEWSSNRATLCVQLQRLTLSDAEYSAMARRLFRTLADTVPCWMRVVIGEGSAGFVCSVGIVGETLL